MAADGKTQRLLFLSGNLVLCVVIAVVMLESTARAPWRVMTLTVSSKNSNATNCGCCPKTRSRTQVQSMKILAEAERSIRKLDRICEKMRLASLDENAVRAREILTACETLSSDTVCRKGILWQ
jgi:hypothetical protein